MILRALAAITAGAAAGAALARLQRKPTPAPQPETHTRSITTYTEHDIANIHATPAVIEPPAAFLEVAIRHGAIFTAYRRAEFTDERAYALMAKHIDSSLRGGK